MYTPISACIYLYTRANLIPVFLQVLCSSVLAPHFDIHVYFIYPYAYTYIIA